MILATKKEGYVKPGIILGMDTTISFTSSLLAILLMRWLTEPIFNFDHFVAEWLGLATLGSLAGFFVIGSYKVILRHSTSRDIGKLGLAVIVKEALLLGCVIFNIFSLKSVYGGYLIVILDALLSLVALVMWRVLIISVMGSTGQSMEVEVYRMGVLVYGTSNKSVSMVSRLEFSPHYNVVGFIDDDKEMDGKLIAGKKVHYAADIKEFDKICGGLGGVQFVLFARPEDELLQKDKIANWCAEMGIHLLVAPKVEEIKLTGKVEEANREISTNAGYIPDGMNGFERNVKRCIDCMLALGLIIFFSPLMLICYVAIKIEDHGPALYKQERIGRFGRPFNILKFRSMRTDAEAFGPALYAGDDDPRLTKTGKFLRQHHLDELPQLFNVFVGDMAFIGYRPERQFYIDQIMEVDQRYYYLYQIRPGVTSYATLHNGYADSVEKMVRRLQFDLYYLKNRSWWFDMKVLWQTFTSIIFGKKF